MNGVYLSVSIDCECDKGPAWRVRKPLSFVGVTEGMGKRLGPLFKNRHAKATYLLSGEVLQDAASIDVVRALAREAEVGTHLHGELVGPDAFVPDVTEAFQRDYPAAIEREKMTNLSRSFRDVFGHDAKSFRAGRFGIGAASIGILEDLGYTVESSVTPHLDWSSKGSRGLSYVGAPTQPYHPDPIAPERAGSARIWEVPVTIRPRALGRLPAVGRFVEPRWLRPTWGDGDALCNLAREEVRASRLRAPDRPVVLNAMFHNVEIVPGQSPYAADEASAQAILGRLDALLAFAERESIKVVGLADLPEILS